MTHHIETHSMATGSPLLYFLSFSDFLVGSGPGEISSAQV